MSPAMIVIVAPVAGLVAMIALASPASAAGAESAVITGPGIDEPIELDFYDPDVPSQRELGEQTGAWFVPTDDQVSEPLMAEAPDVELGPRYTLTWYMLGPEELPLSERAIRQELYPDAEGGPLAHTPRRQDGWVRGDLWEGAVGWYRAPDRLQDTLSRLGVPISGVSQWPSLTWPIGVAAAGTAIVVGVSIVVRYRFGAQTETSTS
jgi:hypothetical protein